MTQEEKNLLFKDLCGRLPYRVKCRQFKSDSQICTLTADLLESDKIDNLEPYLRKMPSLDSEEYLDFDCNRGPDIDWFNSHHIDYRGLIEKGLAIEAPDNMYNNQQIKTMEENKKWEILKKKQAENIAKLAEKHPDSWFYSLEMKKPIYQRTGFAPNDGKCYNCGRNIAERITLEELGDYIITGCPYCNYSFCD